MLSVETVDNVSATKQQAPENAVGLTTTKAPFIEDVQNKGQLFINQPYELYSEANQDAWRKLYARILPKWQTLAHPKFMEGVEHLALNPDRIPRMEEINQFLEPLTAFKAKAVSGYIPAFLFFECLRHREFPTTITIRDNQKLDYLPEPDIFHDIAGHVPMHTDPQFADVLVRFGEVAHNVTVLLADEKDQEERMLKLKSIVKAMARFFWYTVEFGLMRKPGGKKGELCVYGSGILSSFGEIDYSIESPKAQRYPFLLEWVVNQYFEINHYQELYFIVDSFDHLFSEINKLEQWIFDGKLYNVAKGEPLLEAEHLKSFADAIAQR